MVTYNRVLKLQFFLFPVRSRLVLFSLFGAPNRVILFSKLSLQSLFNQLSFFRLRLKIRFFLKKFWFKEQFAHGFACVSLLIFNFGLVQGTDQDTKHGLPSFAFTTCTKIETWPFLVLIFRDSCGAFWGFCSFNLGVNWGNTRQLQRQCKAFICASKIHILFGRHT